MTVCRTTLGPCFTATILCATFLCTSSGCGLGRSALQADAQPDASAERIDLVANAEEVQPDAQAIQFAAGEMPLSPAVEQEAPSDESGSWSRWIPKLGWPKRVPLPRTDLAEDAGFDLTETPDQSAGPAGYEF